MFEKAKLVLAAMYMQMTMAMQKFDESDKGMLDAVEIVKALGLIVVIGAIMVFIADKTLIATGTPSNAYLYNFSNNTLSAASTGSSFVVILIIAFIGSIAIGYMYFFGKKR